MKKFIFLIMLALTVFLTGCFDDDDNYSLGKIWIGFGTIDEVNSEPLEYKITLDNGDVLVPVASSYHQWYYHGTNDPNSRLKDGDRVLINFTILDDNSDGNNDPTEYYIRVNSVKKILMKGIIDITEENQDSIGNDPITVKEVWMTDSLLNFELKYWGRYKTHFINLVKQPGVITAADQPIELELRHNSNDDIQDISYAAYVSFKLDSIKIAGLDSVQFHVTGIDYDGETFDYDGVYHYGESN